MSDTHLKFMLFAHDLKVLQDAIAYGIREFMVDCEWRGKNERQSGADTDCSHVSLATLAVAAAIPEAKINCRINGFGAWTEKEIEVAIEHGAHRIFLPMVRRMVEVERFLRRIDGRTRPAILIETDEAVRIAVDLATLPLDAVYIGLNDLAISRGYSMIFKALCDGTVERVRECFPHIHFGFGGVTLLGCGRPCPSELLLAELERLDCDFSFLRRSFYRDIAGRDVAMEIAMLRTFWEELARRDDQTRTFHKQQLDRFILESIGTSDK